MSVTIFLSYADLGFLGAGMKYAAESFSKGDRKEEIRLVGFSHFILLVMVLVISGIFLFLSFRPQMLISGIESAKQVDTARTLLIILAVFSPTVVLQRTLQMIFGIRLQEYILQRINILGNLTKIVSVFFFFGFGRYDIIGYFLFVQLVNLVCAIAGLLQARKQYDYDFTLLLKQFRFSKEIFARTKKLAFTSLFVTLSWIIYYELDSFAIGRMLGAKEVAIYAIGFTILSFFRSLLGVFFAPFSARFNHFIGAGNHEELKQFYLHILTIALPVVVFPITAVVLFAKPVVISWVGIDYAASIEIVQWLVLCNVLAFVSYPAGMLMVARERLGEMYTISFLMPVVYWVGIVSTYGVWGIKSFAIFKFVAFAISGSIYLWISLRFLNIPVMAFLKRNVLPYLPGLVLMAIVLVLFRDSYIQNKSKLYLLLNALIMGAAVIGAFGISLISVPQLKAYVFRTIRSIGSK